MTLATALQCLQSPVIKSFSHVDSVALNYNSDGNRVIGKKSFSNTENDVNFLNFKWSDVCCNISLICSTYWCYDTCARFVQGPHLCCIQCHKRCFCINCLGFSRSVWDQFAFQSFKLLHCSNCTAFGMLVCKFYSDLSLPSCGVHDYSLGLHIIKY